MTLSVCVTLVGLASAIYLERPREATFAPAPPAAAEARGDRTGAIVVSDTSATSAAPATSTDIPAPPPPASRAEPPAEPNAGSTAPRAETVPPQIAMLETPAQAPAAPSVTMAPPIAAPTTATQRYWVEYGVFVGERYAERLQQALADQGLDAMLVPTRTPKGRPLVRVRSAPLADYAQARAAAQSAHSALKISTLVHRVAAPAPSAVAAASAPDRGYWVQFGAFPHRDQAARLQSELGRAGVETIVSLMRGSSGRPLYYVRSTPLPDRGSALAIATRGRAAAKIDALIGRSLARPAVEPPPKETRSEPARPRAG